MRMTYPKLPEIIQQCGTCHSVFSLLTLARMEARLYSFEITFELRDPMRTIAKVFCPLCWRDRVWSLMHFDVVGLGFICVTDVTAFRLREFTR